MKVGEQALFFARLKGLSRRDATERLRTWFERFGIEAWWGDKRVEELSKGMAQKVQFIVTVLHRPELLIFDEPFSGFDPINANLLKEEILALRDAGATVIFSTHNMASVEEVCDHITLIDKSHDILSGRVADIRRSHGDNLFDVTWRGDAAPSKRRARPLRAARPHRRRLGLPHGPHPHRPERRRARRARGAQRGGRDPLFQRGDSLDERHLIRP